MAEPRISALTKALFVVNNRRECFWKIPLNFVAIAGMSALVALLLGFDILQTVITNVIVAAPFLVGGTINALHLTQLQNQMTTMAMTDQLTGLSNRYAFFNETRQALSAGKSGTIALCDADYFKKINDAYGHAAGDICLCSIAQYLKSAIPEDAILARIGGEEFAIFLPDAPKRITDTIISDALCGPIPFNAPGEDIHKRQITLSIGTSRTKTGATLEDLMRHADMALYQAKKSGRARYVAWDPGATSAMQKSA